MSLYMHTYEQTYEDTYVCMYRQWLDPFGGILFEIESGHSHTSVNKYIHTYVCAYTYMYQESPRSGESDCY